MIEFAFPECCLAVFLPVLVKILLKPEYGTEKTDTAIKTPFFRELAKLPSIRANQRIVMENGLESFSFMNLIRFLAWIMLILASMRPIFIGDEIPLEREGRNLVLAMDISGSMLTPDFMLNGKKSKRIDVAKKLTSDFLKKRKGDRVSIVVFGSTAEIFVPLTYDINTALKLLKEADVGLLKQNTAIGDAIGESINALSTSKAESSVLILLSDGDSNSGTLTPEEATELAKNHKVKIYTIGIGGDDFAIPMPFGKIKKIKNLGFNEEALISIAKSTGGEYFFAQNTEKLKKIYDYIDKAEKIENEDKMAFRPKKELFYWPLGISFFLFALIILYKAKNR